MLSHSERFWCVVNDISIVAFFPVEVVAGADAEAVEYLRRAVEIRPDYAQAHQNLGLLLLRMGQYAEGWHESEWRWHTPQFKPFETDHPVWNGEGLKGTLLVHTEQGAGDAIQFARYLSMCAERCDKILLLCPENLVRLFAAIPAVDECRGPGDLDKKSFQARISLMSLPIVFDTHDGNIPAVTPYLEVPTPDQPALPKGKTGGVKVGIVWAGNPDQGNNHLRSCDIETFMPVLRVPGVDFYSLQKGERANDINNLPDDVSVIDLDARINDYADTAALVQQLDLVISVDTSVAHLAAALDKPTWTLVYYNADWRYQLESESCLWYPSMRQFWQVEPKQWQPVFEQVVEALVAFSKMASND